MDTFGSDRVFSLIKITRELKVVQPYFIVEIKHGSFPSLCIGDNHGTVLECDIRHGIVNKEIILKHAKTRPQSADST